MEPKDMVAALPATGYVRQKQLVGSTKKGIPAVIPFSPATLWRKVKEGKFPAPVKLSEGVTAWRVVDIRTWMAERK